MIDRLPSAWLRCDAGRAAVAVLWLEGMTQQRIGQAFGHRKPSTVNIAIMQLCERYAVPDDGWLPQGEQRRSFARLAVRRYLEQRV